ncbi:MAG: NAD(+)/NADH kinase [Chloroflexi bacterium]|nr:NAD(+)/NADH kinase [Chloroflexota bacterium]MCH8225084.1 NAD(+)/NADH kinase [Chloroflexota bacterium]
MNKVGIIYNALIPEAKDLSAAILDRLDLPADSWIATADDEATLLQQSKETDLVITVGGDGTILRVVRMTAPSGIPVVGINMGRLGFMTELRAEEAMEKLPLYMTGECRVEARNMIQARVVKGSGGEVNGPYHALNDVVMARGAVSRVVTIACTIDEAKLTTFRADAVIVSTATGSTGYNLAVGGPILDPQSDDLVLKPVAAHIGLSAGIVLSGSTKVALTLERTQPATLSIDGHLDYPLVPGDRVELEQSPMKAKFLRANPVNYFYGTLTQRLGFGVEQARAVRF